MNSHDRANITSKISSARSDGKIFYRIQSVCVDHEISIVLVHGWCLAAITVIEEFR